MNLFKHKIIPILILIIFTTPSYAADSGFNLSGVIENILNFQSQYDEEIFDPVQNFVSAIDKFHQGNVALSYGEFEKTIDSMEVNISLLMFSKSMYETGFFTLAHKASDKLISKYDIKNRFNELNNAYKITYPLNKDQEIYLAKAYSSIYFYNSPEEVAYNLSQKTALLENSDYANYILALSLFECKQYAQALIYINKAIDKNYINSNYKLLKAKTLIALNKNKEAMEYINGLYQKDAVSIYFKNDFDILKQNVKFNLAKNDADKKFYQIYPYFILGSYYKVLKETQGILNFNRNNYQILTLQAMAHLALGDVKTANEEFMESYKLNKKYPYTIMGLADCHFINNEYKEAIKYYSNIKEEDLLNEAKIKLNLTYQISNTKDKKDLKLTEQIKDKSFYEYYLIANNLLKNNTRYKKEYIALSLASNPVYINTFNLILDEDFKNKDTTKMSKLIFILSFLSPESAPYYYYLASNLDLLGYKKEAFQKIRKALIIDPDYKPAIDLMTRLQNELI